MTNLAWGITGAADKLEATFEEVEKVAALEDVRVTTFITKAGVEVVVYRGLKDRLAAISNGEPFREICSARSHGATSHLSRRFFSRAYEALLIAPCSSNTLCKLNCGIADTPVTNAACWALKGGCSVFVLQTHLTISRHEYPFKVRIKEDACRRCDACPPERICEFDAIKRKRKFPIIDPLKCKPCGECVSACPYDAVVADETFRLSKRMVDQEAAESLSKVKGVAVLKETRQIGQTLQRYTVKLPGMRLDE